MPVLLLIGRSACLFAKRRRIARHLVSLSLFLTPLALTADPFELIPREDPLSPEESLAAFEVEGSYKLELVAAEPLVTDPVELRFDASGRMYVAEMRDYPLGPQDGSPPQSRIRLLEDTDGDGKMDTSLIWADQLEYVQGIVLVNGGILATTWNAIVFLKDTDGDDRADTRETLYVSDEPRHSQVIVSSPRWGPGMQIYFNNGLDTDTLIDSSNSESIDITRSGIRLDPYDSWKLSLVEGRGQYGATFDALGDHYYTTNRNPIIMTVLPRAVVQRNPYSGLSTGQADIYPVGATIYPVTITLTASDVHAGTYTAACGTHSYHGNALPELEDSLLVCDPTAQLVSRHKLNPKGGLYQATAVRERPQSEFLRSRDAWTRPVNLTSGPDGALYLCDMYRRFIDHPMFLPDDYSQRFDMRTGSDLGRIYRLVPQDPDRLPENERISPDDPDQWPVLLTHKNQWHRSTASQLIRESDAFPHEKIVSILKSSSHDHGQKEAFHILESKGLVTNEFLSSALASSQTSLVRAALDYLIEHPDGTDSHRATLISLVNHPNERVAFLSIAALGNLKGEDIIDVLVDKLLESPEDPWLQSVVLSHRNNLAAEVLRELLEHPEPLPISLVARFSETTSREADADHLGTLLAFLERPLPDTTKFAILDGVDAGLRFQNRWPSIASLRSLLSDDTHGLSLSSHAIRRVFEEINTTALNSRAKMEERLAAISLVRTLPSESALTLFGELIAFDQPASIQEAALTIAHHLPRESVADLLFQRWNALGSTAQAAALTYLNTTDKTRIQLLEKMKAGVIPKSLLDPMSRWRYLRSKNETLKAIAHELFGEQDDDRQSLVSQYVSAVPQKTGDTIRGEELFATNCALCHTFQGAGQNVGPDITDVRNKPLYGLLTDILDPNRLVESRFGSHHVETKDGRSLMGLITEENESGITLVAPGIEEEIPYNQIEGKKATGLSLMPPGFENALDPQAMADLIAYLTN